VDYSKAIVDNKEVTVRNLRTCKLFEVSPVIWGMNPATTTLGAKQENTDTPKAEDDTHERKQALVESLRAALAEAEALLESPAPAEEAGRAEDADDQGAGPEPPPTPTDTERERLELLSQIEARLTEV